MMKVAVGVALLLLMDGLWIYLYMGSRYATMVRKVQGAGVRIRPVYALLAYALMIAGLVAYVVPRAVDAPSGAKAGALFGLILYGVYNATLLAVIKHWSRATAAIDTIWGVLMFAVVGAAVGITST